MKQTEKRRFILHTLFSSLFLGGMCYFFIAVFQPFGTYTYRHSNKYLLLLPYGFFVFFGFLCTALLMRKATTDWSWQLEVKKGLILLFFCSILGYLYNMLFISHHPFSLIGWLEMAVYTLLIGLPICVLHSLLCYVWYRERSMLNQEHFTANIGEWLVNKEEGEEMGKKDEVVSIKTDVVQETFTLRKCDFIYAQSEGNYCTVCYLVEGRLHQQLMRLPLKKLKEQLTLVSIQYCHRSYLINTIHLQGVKGNAQGGKVRLNYIEQPLPVSRTYIQKLKENKANLT
ncbi:LytTR family DNA-binding domain-containing protein [Myroides sp. DF42-4-2]|uniref:LytTR family DNA-binding domain-containing protein n=1 Tax=unclassified Myroides TaxID=2642485 RepID=UPI00257536DF|nr:LytTR family DNA-binding domain-containing protein [Myroides sp. DF42-4-2]MDM1406446.1 LytTR family transcriptional regulator [Myroides sp. DF42-4-2]